MPYEIIPNGEIKLYKEVPLDSDYNHTWYFENATDQANKFAGFLNPTYHTFSDNSYIRVERNTIKIEAPIGGLNGVNYMSFINKTPFENRTYYAFVTDIEYVNNNTTRIVYEIDRMQSFFFDYELDPCFVEREHASSDGLFENLVPEEFNQLDMVINHHDDSYLFRSHFQNNQVSDYICVIARPNSMTDQIITELSTNNKMLYKGAPFPFYVNPVLIYTFQGDIKYPTTYHYIFDDTLSKAENFNKYVIYGLTHADWTISDTYIVPFDLHNLTQYDPTVAGSGEAHDTKPFEISKYFYDVNSNISYEPKNNKLYTSPYKKIKLESLLDGSKEYELQKFILNTSQIDTDSVMKMYFGSHFYEVPIACGYIRPLSYLKNDSFGGTQSGLTLDHLSYSFPFAIDAYAQYRAQKADSTNFNALLRAFSAIPNSLQTFNFSNNKVGRIRGITPEVATMGAVSSGLNAISGVISENITASLAEDKIIGNLTESLAVLEISPMGCSIVEYNIKPEMAEIIDNYFTMYGYAKKTIKQPNRKARAYFTYVKTANCCIHPLQKGLNNNDIQIIQAIYNKGITFWKSTVTYPGDYTSIVLENNTPTGVEGG